ncbi:MAG TPA: hypothetical protein VGC18_06085 [Lacisediminihabitans sp.]|uniref:hypothetical protein n=1 Tax=Lacisediminihabitans sp. TaxID=2787631 RepID=UPI002EDA33A7
MTIDQPGKRLAIRSVLPVWLLVVIAAILVAFLSPPSDYLVWLPRVLAVATLITFCLQLATEEKNGFVNRVMTSLGGSIVILAIATIVLGAVQLASV